MHDQIVIAVDQSLGALKLRGREQALGLTGKLEPTIGTQDVMLQTGLSKSGVHKAKDANRLFAFRLEGRNVDRFPLLQFKARACCQHRR